MDRKMKLNRHQLPYAGRADVNGEDISGSAANCTIEYPKGLKWTRQRKSVYRVLWETTEPLNAIQIYNLAERDAEGGEYAVSTIYRILAVFEERGLVEKSTWMGDGTVVYTLNRGGHTHYAVCLQCRRRIPLQSCPFAHMHLNSGAEEFTVTGHKLELYGYCRDCQDAVNTGK